MAQGGISVPISPEEIASSPAEIGAISRDEILQSVWGLDPHGLGHTRTIDMHVARLRDKLGDRPEPDGNQLIATVRGKGYMVATDALRDAPSEVDS